MKKSLTKNIDLEIFLGFKVKKSVRLRKKIKKLPKIKKSVIEKDVEII